MNETPSGKKIVGFYVVAILGAFLIMAALVAAIKNYSKPADLNAARSEERRKALAQIRNENSDALDNYAWQNQAKGIIRLPIERAMKLTIEEWQNPAAARSKLVSRAEVAGAPPPRPPEKPSQYE